MTDVKDNGEVFTLAPRRGYGFNLVEVNENGSVFCRGRLTEMGNDGCFRHLNSMVGDKVYKLSLSHGGYCNTAQAAEIGAAFLRRINQVQLPDESRVEKRINQAMNIPGFN